MANTATQNPKSKTTKSDATSTAAVPATKAPLTPETTQEAPKKELPKLPKGWSKENARILLKDYEQGKPYPAGTLCLISDEVLPDYNAAADIVVIPTTIIGNLDRAGVTGPYKQ